MNSRLFFFAVKHFYSGGLLGEKGIRMKHTFFCKFPCIPHDDSIDRLVKQTGYAPSLENSSLVENIILQRYGLSEHEIDYIMQDTFTQED